MPPVADQTVPAKRATREATPATKGDAPASKAAGARARAAAAPRSNLPILTLDRFEQAMQIARLAAEHDLPELSLRAVHESLRAGPPVVPANPNETPASDPSRPACSTRDRSTRPSPRVVANLVELERLWQKHHFADAAVYQALRDAVLPPGRPTEVFLYATPLSQNALRHPQSVGMILATWAVRAGKVDDLKQALVDPAGPGDGRAARRGPLGPARPGRERAGARPWPHSRALPRG